MPEHSEPIHRLSILVVDDEPNIRKTLGYCLESEGHVVFAVSTPEDARREASERIFDLAFIDIRLGEENGLELLAPLLAGLPWLKIVVMTAYASIDTAIEAMRRGATDYIVKPFTSDQVKFLTRRIAKVRALEQEISSLKEDVLHLGPEPIFQSRNLAVQRALETARKAAASEAVILLQGESGTGKSMLAKGVHQWSPRAARRLSVVSCPAIPADLLESELFGHAKGAFTGAVRDNPGRIAGCEGGTLFLDEIAELAPSTQAKLLRFLQDKEYERVGDPHPRRADVRIITATNANLEKRLAQGRFREDLFYRLNVIPITLPALRERSEDIGPLALGFLRFFAHLNHRVVQGFTEEAMTILQNHTWPGNLRELRNLVERAVILTSGDEIGINDLPEDLKPKESFPALGDPVPLSTIEELHIRKVLAVSHSLQEAADILGIDQATLWRRRKAYGI